MKKYLYPSVLSIGAFLLSYFAIMWAGLKGTVPVHCATFGRMSMRVFLPLKTPAFSFEIWVALLIAMFVFAITLPKDNKYTKIAWAVFFITLGVYVCYAFLNWPSCL